MRRELRISAGSLAMQEGGSGIMPREEQDLYRQATESAKVVRPQCGTVLYRLVGLTPQSALMI